MNRMSFFVPLGTFLVILLIGYAGFQLGDRNVLPSPLVGKPFPEFSAATLKDQSHSVSRQALVGAPVLVNLWATWCPTCKAEHAQLMQIQQTGLLRIVGINHKDDPQQALRWLDDFGDPYDFNIVDADGRLAVELGVYGAPESFLLNAAGEVVYKRVGDVNERIWQDEILPRLQQMGVVREPALAETTSS